MPNGLFDDDETQTPMPVSCAIPESPLAARMRPVTLSEFIGHQAVVGPLSQLRKSIETDRLTSLLFWGPPGCGKSTLARIIAGATRAAFEDYSAVTSGVADIRKVIDAARSRMKRGEKTILFVDEIHRWNKSQQDALLPHVEEGTVVLVGATTENPLFELNSALLSRMRLFRFEPLSEDELRLVLERACKDHERGLGAMNVHIEDDAMRYLCGMADGDARRALNALEAAAMSVEPVEGARRINLAAAQEAAQQRAPRYDRVGDEHYNTISAFIKSIRGSDPDAGLYWLAVMLNAGEDPRFIARRLVILASEDVGNADPMALVLANAAVQAVLFVGMPESRLILSQTVCYLAAAAKSNACTVAIGRAEQEIATNGVGIVPAALRDPRSVMGKAVAGKAPYLYPHDYPAHYVDQQYLPEAVQSAPYYEPTQEGNEARVAARMAARRAPQEP